MIVGALANTAVTGVVAEPVSPFASVAVAPRITLPAVEGVHEIVKGEPILLPIATPLAVKSTREIVLLLPTAVALAVTVVAAPTTTFEFAAGAVIATAGFCETAAAETTMLLEAEVAVAVFESVTLAVIANVPFVVGVQLAVTVEEDGDVTVASNVLPEKNSTFEIVAAEVSVTVALRVVVAPTVPVAGIDSVTDGPVTVTLTTEEVVVAPAESVALAERETTPVADGAQLSVNGAVNEVATVVPPAIRSTRLREAPPFATAETATDCVVPSATLAPFAGDVIEIVGAWALAALMVILEVLEVTSPLFESVTLAVSENVPDEVGVQLVVTVEDDGELIAWIDVPFAKNSTFKIVADEVSPTVAVNVVAVPTVPVVGADSVIEGPVTLTFTAGEVAVNPFESVALAVNDVIPKTVVGFQ